MKKTIFVLMMLLLPALAEAARPDERLSDPVLEARAEALDKKLRCVVCQSQSIADSDAPLARDLRLLVRERLVAGDTDEQVLAFISDPNRYGDYVLLQPKIQSRTFLLWTFPLLVMLIGGGIAMRAIARSGQSFEMDDEDII